MNTLNETQISTGEQLIMWYKNHRNYLLKHVFRVSPTGIVWSPTFALLTRKLKDGSREYLWIDCRTETMDAIDGQTSVVLVTKIPPSVHPVEEDYFYAYTQEVDKWNALPERLQKTYAHEFMGRVRDIPNEERTQRSHDTGMFMFTTLLRYLQEKKSRTLSISIYKDKDKEERKKEIKGEDRYAYFPFERMWIRCG